MQSHVGKFYKIVFEKYFSLLSFPQQSCQWVIEWFSLKGTHWFFNRIPLVRSSTARLSYPHLWVLILAIATICALRTDAPVRVSLASPATKEPGNSVLCPGILLLTPSSSTLSTWSTSLPCVFGEVFQARTVLDGSGPRGTEVNKSPVLLRLSNYFWLWLHFHEVPGCRQRLWHPECSQHFFSLRQACAPYRMGIRSRILFFSEMWSMCFCGFSSVPALFANIHSFRFRWEFEYWHGVGFPQAVICGITRL